MPRGRAANCVSPPARTRLSSAPMLGMVTAEGESRKGRNGVGLRDAHTVVFAISEDEVSFGAFARLFRDTLKCPNALFLDGGSVPTLYIPGGLRGGNFLPLGPMLGVYGK